MSECYTHIHTAMQALMRSGYTVASTPAFMAGACGANPFYMYRILKRKRNHDLASVANRIRSENTGKFLRTLISYASTPTQQSYALGFISHYTTECTLSPYIAAMCEEGGPYNEEHGAFILANSIDSTLYYENFKTYTVPLHASTPVLITDELASVCVLLRNSIAKVYGVYIPILALADAFHDNVTVRNMMFSKPKIKSIYLKLSEPKKMPDGVGPLSCRTQPAPSLRHLPDTWTNPFSGETMNLTLSEVVALAQQTAAVCISAAMGNWLGTLEDGKLSTILGNNDYSTGMPCKEN